MVNYMMGNGLEERRMEVVCGRALMEILTLVSGKMEKFKDLEYLLLNKEIDMRDNSKIQ